jgi:hypothetical protein
MSKSDSGLFVGTAGARITRDSISAHREKFLDKTVGQINKMLQKRGYETTIRKSKFSTSRAKVIVVGNSSKERNITQVQVSPGSKRHGDVPYVKISTNDIGIQKIIDAKPSEYKTDGTEKATLLFRRYY